jgi:hypothetical protein
VRIGAALAAIGVLGGIHPLSFDHPQLPEAAGWFPKKRELSFVFRFPDIKKRQLAKEREELRINRDMGRLLLRESNIKCCDQEFSLLAGGEKRTTNYYPSKSFARQYTNGNEDRPQHAGRLASIYYMELHVKEAASWFFPTGAFRGAIPSGRPNALVNVPNGPNDYRVQVRPLNYSESVGASLRGLGGRFDMLRLRGGFLPQAPSGRPEADRRSNKEQSQDIDRVIDEPMDIVAEPDPDFRQGGQLFLCIGAALIVLAVTLNTFKPNRLRSLLLWPSCVIGIFAFYGGLLLLR